VAHQLLEEHNSLLTNHKPQMAQTGCQKTVDAT